MNYKVEDVAKTLFRVYVSQFYKMSLRDTFIKSNLNYLSDELLLPCY